MKSEPLRVFRLFCNSPRLSVKSNLKRRSEITPSSDPYRICLSRRSGKKIVGRIGLVSQFPRSPYRLAKNSGSLVVRKKTRVLLKATMILLREEVRDTVPVPRRLRPRHLRRAVHQRARKRPWRSGTRRARRERSSDRQRPRIRSRGTREGRERACSLS